MGASPSASGLSNHALPSPRLPVPDDEDEPPGSQTCHLPSNLEVTEECVGGDGGHGLERRGSAVRSTVYSTALSTEDVHDEDKLPAAFSTVPTVDTVVDELPRRMLGLHIDRLKTLFRPMHPVGSSPGYKQSFLATVKYSPLNVCLLLIPVSWALQFTHQNDTLVFIFSCFSILPLAALLGFGTEQIALRTSSAVGGLLNATLGNIVEMIIAGIALKEVGIIHDVLMEPPN